MIEARIGGRKTQMRHALVAQQPHAASREMHKLHAPSCPATFSISAHAPQARRAVADAGRSATLVHGF
jgi:hypothetical protein